MVGKVLLLVIVCVTGLMIYLFTGLFVVQPVGAVPEGATIWYVRHGVDLPFVSSADGIILAAGQDVSLLARGFVMAKVLELIHQKKIVRLPYFNSLYLLSTRGRELVN